MAKKYMKKCSKLLIRDMQIKTAIEGDSVKNLPAMQKTWVHFRFRKIPWRKKWQPTPVFFPGESHGQRTLAGYSPWGCKSWT